MNEDLVFRFNVVEEILQKRPENALKLLSKHYSIVEPDLHVGVIKGHSVKALGVYTSKKKSIYVRDRKILYNPYVILHEFYHHLRTSSTVHRGTEKHANLFAKEYLIAHFIYKNSKDLISK